MVRPSSIGFVLLPIDLRAAVLYFDYLLTLGDEVRFVWPTKRLTLVAIVFYLNRYISLLGYIPILFGRYLLTLSSDKNKVFWIFSGALRADHEIFAGVSTFSSCYEGPISWLSRCHNLLKYHQYLAGFIQIIAGRKTHL